VRQLNEDSLLAYPPVFLVADGMGGHAAGDVASRLAVEEFSQLAGRSSASADEVHDCFQRTADRLRETVDAGRTAGTTVAGVAITTHDGASYWLVFNIGDSRVYRLAGGELEQISVDHSVVQELVDRGEISVESARDHPERHVITRAVGTGADPEPDYWLIPAGTADRLLICSDGLTSELDDPALQRILNSVADPQETAQQLVAGALAHGGKDNVSAVVVDVAATLRGADVEATARSSRRGGLLADDQSGRPEAWDDEIDGATVPRPTRSTVPEVHR
jgi:protein phosphatase